MYYYSNRQWVMVIAAGIAVVIGLIAGMAAAFA